MRIAKIVVAFMVGTLLGGCSTPKTAFDQESRQSIKRIALINVPEPRYMLYPGFSLGSAPLMAFGLVGGFFAGTIEETRIENATVQFAEELLPYKMALAPAVLDPLERALKDKGYEVVRVPEPPRHPRNFLYQFDEIKERFDAVVVPELTAQYSPSGGAMAPRVSFSVSLMRRQDNKVLFAETYIYGPRVSGDSAYLPSDPRFTMESIDAVHENPKLAAEGLSTGAAKIAERMLSDL